MSDHIELKKAALRVVEIESSEGESISDAWEDFESAANPAAVLALIAEIDQLKSDSLCPACEGSGEGWVRSDNGPDAHNIQVDCPECFGPGTMLGAYQAMKIQRDSQIERTVKAGGDLLFMRSERDQLKAEVERIAAMNHAQFGDAIRSNAERDQLKAEVERLTADNASLRGSCAKLGVEHAGMVRIHRKANTEIRRLSAEVEALRKDAERYRWLSKGVGIDSESIDAAMSKGAKP